MQDLHGSAVAEGDADGSSREPIEFRDLRTGRVTQVTADPANGKFRTQLPQGRYNVQQGATHTTITALSGGIYHVDLRPSRVFDFDVATETTHDGEVTLRIHAEGAGVHTLEVKTYNLGMQEPGTQTIELRPGHDAEVVRQGRVPASGTPWVIVVIPDGSLNEHREVTGIISAGR
jgi:hypothetical protein